MRAILTNQTTIDELLHADPCLKKLFDDVDQNLFDLPPKSPYSALIGAIVGQKIRFTQARDIRSKLYKTLGSVEFQPADTQSLTNDQLTHIIGLDERQIQILRRVEKWCLDHNDWATPDGLAQMQRQINGIGPWTIQVVKLTMLSDLDIFPTNDVFINERLKRLYNLPKRPTPAQVQEMAEKWAPYRSIVCWWLWRWF